MPATDRSHVPDIRAGILRAARERFLHFGYHKTTMAEISRDAGMSAANLYRYFDNKLDLAAECAAATMNERLERLRAIVERGDLSATERLTRYALAIIEHSHDLARSDSRVGELLDTITREHPQLVIDKMAIHRTLIGEILAAGNAAGEFRIDDVETAARDVYSAFIVFDVTLFIGLLSRDEFNARAHGIVSLVVDGMRPRD